jgi:hypothetical protein
VFEAMMKYNEELTKPGVLLALDGLHPTSRGARVQVSGGKRTIVDGPFAEAKELIGGYWLIQVRSKDEALEWASRVPLADDEMVELRQVFELSDFPAEVQQLAAPIRERARRAYLVIVHRCRATTELLLRRACAQLYAPSGSKPLTSVRLAQHARPGR